LKLADPAERRATGISTMAQVMDESPPERPTLLEETIRDFGCAEIWSRPELDLRSRRWIAISAAATTGLADPVESYVRSAFKSGDITLAEMREGVLHFAIYQGWPLARVFDRIVTKVAAELGLEAETPALCDTRWDPEERYRGGVAAYTKIMTFAPPEQPAARRSVDPGHEKRTGMRAAVTAEAGGFEVVSLPDPSPGPDELVIRVAACGVCGSDLKARPFMPPGMVMGHEFGGEVVAVGTGTQGWREGTNVAVLPVVASPLGTVGACVSPGAGLQALVVSVVVEYWAADSLPAASYAVSASV